LSEASSVTFFELALSSSELLSTLNDDLSNESLLLTLSLLINLSLVVGSISDNDDDDDFLINGTDFDAFSAFDAIAGGIVMFALALLFMYTFTGCFVLNVVRFVGEGCFA
jgi:hypothetical protein